MLIGILTLPVHYIKREPDAAWMFTFVRLRCASLQGPSATFTISLSTFRVALNMQKHVTEVMFLSRLAWEEFSNTFPRIAKQ